MGGTSCIGARYVGARGVGMRRIGTGSLGRRGVNAAERRIEVPHYVRKWQLQRRPAAF